MPSYLSYKHGMDDDNDITWITVKGNHIPIKKGQSKGDAVKEFFEKKNVVSKAEKTSKTESSEKETRKSLALKIAELVNPKNISQKEYARRMLEGHGVLKPYKKADLEKEYKRRLEDKERSSGGSDNVSKHVPEKYQKAYNEVLERVKSNKENPEINENQVVNDAIATGKYSGKDVTRRVDLFWEYQEKGLKPIPSGEEMPYDTMRRYTTGGRWENGELVDATWNSDRLKKQKEILGRDFKDWKDKLPEKGQKPRLVILGGRGGSGKSAFTNGSLGDDGYDKKKFLVVDPDAYKEQLPEYKKLMDDGSPYAGLNAWEVHEESSWMKKQALATAKSLGINVVLDGTLAKSKSVLKTIEEFEKAGYDVEGAYMHLPREKSAVRGLLRGMKGRWVPTKNLLDMKNNEEVFTELLPKFKKWSMYDNDVPLGEKPKLVAKSE